MQPSDSLRTLKGIGVKSAEALAGLGLNTVGDLVTYYPRAYDTYKRPTFISEAAEGYICAVEAAITAPAKTIRAGRFIIVTLTLNDGSGSITLNWYNQPYLSKTLRTGSRFIFRGMVSMRHHILTMTQPQIFTKEKYLLKMREMQPVYHLTGGVSNNLLIKSVSQVRECFPLYKDFLTPKQRKELDLTGLQDALEEIHFPVNEERLAAARRRLVFNEFFAFTGMGRISAAERQNEANPWQCKEFCACEQLIASLPFKLTDSQYKAYEEIKGDLSSQYLSGRMLQGDVGCGKTIIALLAITAAVAAGHKACIMAPTEVLARQHYDEFCKRTHFLGYHVVLLTGKLTAAEKKAAREDIASGYADIIVGTHALISEGVEIKDLAVAVIDEQHRFGVKQREAIAAHGLKPYVLVMSATPIPRSLAIILYGDLKLTVIDELPKDRLPIKNCVIDSSRRDTAYSFILKEIAAGRQAYIICPMIEESEELDAENVTEYEARLKEQFKDQKLTIAALHGKLKSDEKNRILDDFYSGQINILISTTVVEVGVNVPNASVMMVENAERFGLAQLHQLRGRVGRGAYQSYCIFVKGIDSDKIDERLNILVKYNDGMTIAEKDLALRGPGELFGLKQSGELSFELGDIYNDSDILKKATEFSASLKPDELTQIFEEHPLIFKSVNSYANVL